MGRIVHVERRSELRRAVEVGCAGWKWSLFDAEWPEVLGRVAGGQVDDGKQRGATSLSSPVSQDENWSALGTRVSAPCVAEMSRLCLLVFLVRGRITWTANAVTRQGPCTCTTGVVVSQSLWHSMGSPHTK